MGLAIKRHASAAVTRRIVNDHRHIPLMMLIHPTCAILTTGRTGRVSTVVSTASTTAQASTTVPHGGYHDLRSVRHCQTGFSDRSHCGWLVERQSFLIYTIAGKPDSKMTRQYVNRSQQTH